MLFQRSFPCALKLGTNACETFHVASFFSQHYVSSFKCILTAIATLPVFAQRCLFFLSLVLCAFQDQLVYMRGLILKHVQKPMTRDQVCSPWVVALLLELLSRGRVFALTYSCVRPVAPVVLSISHLMRVIIVCVSNTAVYTWVYMVFSADLSVCEGTQQAKVLAFCFYFR